MNKSELLILKQEIVADRTSFLEHLYIVKWAISDCDRAGFYVDYGILFGIEYGMYKLSKELFLDCLDMIIYNRDNPNYQKSVSIRNQKRPMLEHISHRLTTGLM